MRFRRRSGDDLEAQLRNARPEPRPELTHVLAERVRPAREGFIERVGRVPFTMAGGLTAMVLIAVIALGGASYPLDAASKALNLQNMAIKPDIKFGTNKPTNAQYGPRVNVCVGGFVRLRLYQSEANLLVAQGRVVIGPCSGATPPKKTPRMNVCIGGYIGLRLSTQQANVLIAQGKAVAGKCP